MSIATATVGVFDITFDEINKLWTASRDGKIECTSNDPHGLIEPLAPVLAKAAFESKLSEIKLEIHELLDRAVKAIDLLDKRVAYWVGPGYASAPKLPLIIGITDEGTSQYAVARPPHSFIGDKYRVSHYPPHVVFATADRAKLRREYRKLCLEALLASEVSDCYDPIERALYEVAATIPYPQDCQCQDPSRGLMANDCHFGDHNGWEVMHFIGGLDFPCTCAQQETAVA